MTCTEPPRGTSFLDPKRDLARRDCLLLAATELFVARDRHDRSERRLFGELALNLLPDTPVGDRRRIACLLARTPDAPPEVLNALAADPDPLVAYPVLLHAAVLPEDTLLAVAERGPDSLRRALSRRPELPESVLERLAARGDEAAVRLLIAHGRPLLPVPALAALCARPEIMAVIGPELAGRALLPSDLLIAHYPTLDAANRQRAIAAAELRALADRARQGGTRAPQPAFKPALLQRIVAAALTGGRASFARQIAYALGLSAGLAARVTVDASGEPLVVCLKALGLAPASVATVVVRIVGRTLSIEQLRALLAFHDALSPAAALVLVGRWRVLEGGQAATPERHAPLHQETRLQASRSGSEAPAPARKDVDRERQAS
ncbi:hypothetical protein SL003B_2945 [Polymorphum gilvum SL003B-26A1]|uniref:DUF2336 domain-containing protein n=2 Tax=Polymorphum TaxID=991903 RepID=F2IV37_POLGS|nr:hypothetical protein SL003B_2945 [Polymorphum gilvum SL003B-26A1]